MLTCVLLRIAQERRCGGNGQKSLKILSDGLPTATPGRRRYVKGDLGGLTYLVRRRLLLGAVSSPGLPDGRAWHVPLAASPEP